MVVTIERRLMELGLGEYEARAYLALLQETPATAYQVAKRSHIPTSKIYQVMARLVEKAMALEVRGEERMRYVPVEPEEFLEACRGAMDRTIEGIRGDLASFKRKPDASYIWSLRDRDDFAARARGIVAKARTALLLSTWPEEAALLAPDVAKARRRGVAVAVVFFGGDRGGAGLGQVFAHPIEDTIHAEKGGRGFVAVADSRECLMAVLRDDGSVEGGWSRNAGFVTLAEDYVKHDIYIMKIVRRFDRALVKRFGENYELLRDIFGDRERKR